MELIKTNIILILASFCLLVMLILIIFNPKNTISLEDLNGKWTSFYKNSKIIFVINQNVTKTHWLIKNVGYIFNSSFNLRVKDRFDVRLEICLMEIMQL